RNSSRIAARGGKEVLLPVEAGRLGKDRICGELLRDATRKSDRQAAEKTFAALAKGSANEALDHLMYAVADNPEVPRVVLAYRAYDMLDLVGKEHAHPLLRQSVRYCVDAERWSSNVRHGDCRAVLPKLLEKHGLLKKAAGTRKLDDAGLERLSQNIF